MLVISRHPNESIVFPTLGIEVQVTRVSGLTVRLGVVAPPDVKVLRRELLPEGATPAARAAPPSTHELRNVLSKFGLSVHLARKQAAAGHAARADETLSGALKMLEALEHGWLSREQTPPKPQPGLKALLVEDDANERELLAGLLEMNGCTCDTVADGADALAYLTRERPPNVVLLDMGLPRCGGPEVVRRLRSDKRFKELKILTVSGTDPRTLGIPIGTGGVDGWFQKPLNPNRLWEAIQRSNASPASDN